MKMDVKILAMALREQWLERTKILKPDANRRRPEPSDFFAKPELTIATQEGWERSARELLTTYERLSAERS